MLPNYPFTKVEILWAEDIMGPNLGSLQENLFKSHNQYMWRISQVNIGNKLPFEQIPHQLII